MSRSNFKHNDRVQALWAEDGKWYPAQVLKVKGNGVYLIQFEGWVEKYDFHAHQMRPASAPGPSAASSDSDTSTAKASPFQTHSPPPLPPPASSPMSRPVSGYGSFTFADGKYTGEWANSEPHGRGKMEFTDGNVYEGNFSNGKREGTGVFRWANGDSYVGSYKNGSMEGKGVFTWADGDSYDGEWKNDLMEGKGVYTWADGNSYDGEWKNDKMEGKGVMKFAVDGKTSLPGLSTTWNAGDVCDCVWKADRRHGACRYTFFNGVVYACTFVDGVCKEFDARQAAVRADPKAFKFASDSMVRFL